MFKRFFSLVSIGCLSLSANAALVSFTDRAAWLAAAGGSSDYFEDFDSVTEDIPYYESSPVSVGFTTWTVDGFADGSWRIDAPTARFGSIPSVNGSAFVTTLAFSDNSFYGDAEMSFNPVRAIGFDYAGAPYSSNVGSDIVLTTSLGDSVSVEAMYSGTFFIGLLYTEGESFTSLRWDANEGRVAMGVDNVEAFAPSEVPVPATLWLFGSGIMGLMGIYRKK